MRFTCVECGVEHKISIGTNVSRIVVICPSCTKVNRINLNHSTPKIKKSLLRRIYDFIVWGCHAKV